MRIPDLMAATRRILNPATGKQPDTGWFMAISAVYARVDMYTNI
jgi:hypothetical protein